MRRFGELLRVRGDLALVAGGRRRFAGNLQWTTGRGAAARGYVGRRRLGRGDERPCRARPGNFSRASSGAGMNDGSMTRRILERRNRRPDPRSCTRNSAGPNAMAALAGYANFVGMPRWIPRFATVAFMSWSGFCARTDLRGRSIRSTTRLMTSTILRRPRRLISGQRPPGSGSPVEA